MPRYTLELSAALCLTALSVAALAFPQIMDLRAKRPLRSAEAAAENDVATAGDLVISGGWARAMPSDPLKAAGYLTVTNNGDAADRLVAVSSPLAARPQISPAEPKTSMAATPPATGGLAVPAGGELDLAPGADHLVFPHMKKALRRGDFVPVTLDFAKAGKIDVELPVTAAPRSGSQ